MSTLTDLEGVGSSVAGVVDAVNAYNNYPTDDNRTALINSVSGLVQSIKSTIDDNPALAVLGIAQSLQNAEANLNVISNPNATDQQVYSNLLGFAANSTAAGAGLLQVAAVTNPELEPSVAIFGGISLGFAAAQTTYDLFNPSASAPIPPTVGTITTATDPDGNLSCSYTFPPPGPGASSVQSLALASSGGDLQGSVVITQNSGANPFASIAATDASGVTQNYTLSGVASIYTDVNGTTFSGPTNVNSILLAGDNASIICSTPSDLVVFLGTGGNANLTGTGFTVDSFSNTVTLADNSLAAVTGNSNTITGGSGDTVALIGNNDVAAISNGTIDLGTARAAFSIAGTNDTVDSALAGDTINLTGTNDFANISSGAINLSTANGGFSIVGTGDIVNSALTGDTVALIGNNDVAAISNGTVDLGTARAAFSVAGTNDTVDSVLAGDTINLTGNNDFANISSGAINLGTANGAFSIVGTGDIVNSALTGDTVALIGNNDVAAISNGTVDLGTARAAFSVAGVNDTVDSVLAGDTINLTGNNDFANISSGAIDLGTANGAFSIVGTGDIVNSALTGDTVALIGNNDVAAISNGTVDLGVANAAFSVAGTNDTVDSALTGDTVALAGTGDTLAVSDGMLTLGAGSTATVSGAGDTISGGIDDTVIVSGDSDNVAVGSGGTATLTGVGDSITATNDMVALGGNTSAMVSGSGNTISGGANDTVAVSGNNNSLMLGNGGVATLTGVGFTITATDDSLTFGANASATVNGTSDKVTLGVSATLTESNAEIYFTSNGAVVTIDGSNDTINGGTGDTLTVAGNSDSLTVGSGGTVTLTGLGDAVTATDANLMLGSGSTAVVGGTGDTISGASDDTVTLTGGADTLTLGNGGTADIDASGDLVNLSGGTVNVESAGLSTEVVGDSDNIYGTSDTIDVHGNSDTVTGSGDYDDAVAYDDNTYDDNHNDYDDSSPPYDDVPYTDYGGGSSSGRVAGAHTAINVVGQYDLSHGLATAAAAADAAWNNANAAVAASTDPALTPPAVFEGAVWPSTTITWSFATGSGAPSSPISGTVQAPYQDVIQQAFAVWGAATGITFIQAMPDAKSDIQVGWGAFDTADTSVVGYTTFKSIDGIMQPGALIRLEDPAEDPLIPNATGALIYSSSQTTLLQVALHEIGHAIGLAESSAPNSVMFPDLGQENTTVSAADITNANRLYAKAAATSATGVGPIPQTLGSRNLLHPNALNTNGRALMSDASLVGRNASISVSSSLGLSHTAAETKFTFMDLSAPVTSFRRSRGPTAPGLVGAPGTYANRGGSLTADLGTVDHHVPPIIPKLT
ncbi:MAG: matrixin family metalloprotease [Alphaproteobacteria bacterium]|nr:matrixin family metalloprotease [Alphaproteobacteria bacterium]